MFKELSIRTSNRTELIDITGSITQFVSQSGISDGLACIFVPHTTAGITINESADPSVAHDITNAANSLVPANQNYTHAEGNSDSHIKTSIFGPQINVIIRNNKLVLGTWQGIFFAEFDGPRNRKLYLKLLKD